MATKNEEIKKIVVTSSEEGGLVRSPLLNPEQASIYLGGDLSTETLTNWKCVGMGPCPTKIGRKVYYTIKSLDSFIDQQTEMVIG